MTDRREIIVDHREQAEELKACLQKDYNYTIITKQLTLGDYSFAPKTLIERKTTRDFCLSIIDGRLFRQAWGMANYKGTSLMIVEGLSYISDHEIDMDINAVKGALITLAQTFRLPLLRTRNQQDSAWHLNKLYHKRQQIGEGSQPLRGYTAKTLNTKKAHVLRALPGIGPKMAKALLNEFGTITNLVAASEDDLLKVKGLGPKTIKQIQTVFREPSSFYGFGGDMV